MCIFVMGAGDCFKFSTHFSRGVQSINHMRRVRKDEKIRTKLKKKLEILNRHQSLFRDKMGGS
jgi:hypothetical protein